MQRFTRILLALTILLSGLTLLPFVNLPLEAFGWQRFAGAYQPTLAINYPNGQVGSYFALTGSGFSPNDTATVLVNGTVVGSLPVDGSGNLAFRLSTDQADAGFYVVVTTLHPGASVAFVLNAAAPLRAQEGSGPIFAVPAGLAFTNVLYLPITTR
jgi:hypothetical protein